MVSLSGTRLTSIFEVFDVNVYIAWTIARKTNAVVTHRPDADTIQTLLY